MGHKFHTDNQYYGIPTGNTYSIAGITVLTRTPKMVEVQDFYSGTITWKKIHNWDYFNSDNEWIQYSPKVTISANNQVLDLAY